MEDTTERVIDTDQLLNCGPLSTLGFVIEEKLVSSGKILAPSNVVIRLEEAAAP